ncbi:MAG TPA: hypothetical protein VMT20_19205 [Terriglobia bacterium]|nr:hypothetical protein [Terriglobia bacterium]
MRKRRPQLIVGTGLVVCLFGLRLAPAQDRAMASAPAFGGGVFVTPVAGAPFSAVAVQEMREPLRDGSLFQRKTEALITRDSAGRISNERHEVVPANSTRIPALLSVHLYDPETQLSTFLNPFTHVARQQALSRAPATTPPGNWAQQPKTSPGKNVRLEDLGSAALDGIDVHGYRRTITLGGESTGTGKPVAVVDEYWYSEELRINLLSKHSDPRTGELTITVTNLNRTEPDPSLFEIPQGYKVVDLTPEPAGAQ